MAIKSGNECILILGMHRSGTSTLAGALNLIGFDVGNNLMPPNAFNPKGYFEDMDVYRLNDRLLGAVGRKWDSLYSVSFKHEEWMIREIQSLYLQKFSVSRVSVIKDPRISLLFPLWHKALELLEVRCQVIIAYRNPMEVKDSLEKRDGMNSLKSCLLWARYTLEAEKSTRCLSNRQFIGYNDFLTHPESTIRDVLARMDKSENVPSEVLSKIREFIDDDLRHHRESTEENSLPSWIIDLYGSLQKGPGQFEDFDHALSRLNQTIDLYYSSDMVSTLYRDLDSPKTKLYINTGNGYHEQQSLEEIISYQFGEFIIHFDQLEQFSMIHSLRWDPIENAVITLGITAIEIVDTEENVSLISTRELSSNGRVLADGTWEFHTTDPWIELKVGKVIKHIRIVGNLRPLVTRDVIATLEEQNNQAENRRLESEVRRRKAETERKKLQLKIKQTENRLSESHTRLNQANKRLRELKKENTSLRFYKLLANETPSSTYNRWIKAILYRLDRIFHFDTPIPPSYLTDPLVFNPAYYADKNELSLDSQNVQAVTTHWLEQGLLQGLPSSRVFHVKNYLNTYPDLRKHFQKDYKRAVKHWLEHGIDEGRAGSPEFDATSYIARHPDIRRAMGNNYRKAAYHWLEFGIREGRLGKTTETVASEALTPGGLPNLQRGMMNARHPDHPVVVYESHNLNYQGAPNSLFEIASGMHQRNEFYPVVTAPSDGPLGKAYLEAGIPFFPHGIPHNRLLNPGGHQELIDKLAQSYLDVEAALVHANTLQSFHAILAADKIGIPSIWNIRESENPETYYDYLPDDLKNLAYSCFEKTSAVVFVAEATRQQWIPFLEGKSPHFLITNGINSDRLMKLTYGTHRNLVRASYGIQDDEVVLLNIGTVSPRKGQQDLIDAILLLDPACRQKIILAMAGFNQSQYSNDIYEQLAGLQNSGLRVVTLDESTSDNERRQVAELYLAADVFVLTSRVESYPRVILEAMEFQLAIIATPCFGVKEQLIANESVLYYEEGDAIGLCERISLMVNDRKLQKQLGRAAGKQLLKLNSFDQMLDAYNSVYTSVLQNTNPSN